MKSTEAAPTMEQVKSLEARRCSLQGDLEEERAILKTLAVQARSALRSGEGDSDELARKRMEGRFRVEALEEVIQELEVEITTTRAEALRVTAREELERLAAEASETQERHPRLLAQLESLLRELRPLMTAAAGSHSQGLHLEQAARGLASRFGLAAPEVTVVMVPRGDPRLVGIQRTLGELGRLVIGLPSKAGGRLPEELARDAAHVLGQRWKVETRVGELLDAAGPGPEVQAREEGAAEKERKRAAEAERVVAPVREMVKALESIPPQGGGGLARGY